MLTHPDPEFLILSYEVDKSGKGRLVVQKQIPLFERPRRMAEFFTDLIIHPSGKLAIVSCYAGKLKVVGLKGGKYVEDFDVP
jgi:DNA damage-binding protein 1